MHVTPTSCTYPREFCPVQLHCLRLALQSKSCAHGLEWFYHLLQVGWNHNVEIRAVNNTVWIRCHVGLLQEALRSLFMAGVINYTSQLRSHAVEIQNLMQCNSPLIKEAASMLGFMDLGLGMSNVGVVLQMSHTILDIILKIQINVSNPPLPTLWALLSVCCRY